ncbi:MAG TPA: acetamidase/formamidase family protein [Parvularcula sp.]|nr:acetamidase/formamidase family protein [Parvularcula sp.]HBS35249.1 acetamidase/formamidase family protein [Parvularcula sp.]
MANITLAAAAAAGLAVLPAAAADPELVVGDPTKKCLEDAQCINRLHPSIPMAAHAAPGRRIVFRTRNASDFDLDPAAPVDPRMAGPYGATVHPLAGPVHIDGARRGDALAVTIEKISPGVFGYTQIGGIGLISDQIKGPYRVLWRLGVKSARSDQLPGVAIPNRSFPGVITVLPGVGELSAALEREAALKEAGGTVFPPEPTFASPVDLCGKNGPGRDECLRTIPPREFGGNIDSRYLGVGATIILPCLIDGCGLALGDVHFAQGDGEVSGTAIEMDAEVTVTTKIILGAGERMTGPQLSGPSRLLDIPSRRFFATTGIPVKARAETPPDIAYLASAKVAQLENLSKDISLSARNALAAMIEHMIDAYGLTREQAYIVASVAVDLRISQTVDAPNSGVIAVLPVDIFESGD